MRPLGSAARFYRPVSDTELSPTLFVGNLGPAVGWPASVIEGVLLKLGFKPNVDVCVDIPDESKSFLFLTFEDDATAAEAKQRIQCNNSFARATTVCFAKLSRKYKARVSSASNHAMREAVQTAAEADIPGLSLLPDFVTEAEEQGLLAALAKVPWETLAKRRVCHFGYAFDYLVQQLGVMQTRTVSSDQIAPLPAFCSQVRHHLKQLHTLPEIDQLTVNQYEPGVGLSPHVDAHSAFTGAICSLTLGSCCVMEFWQGGRKVPLFLPARSLLIMAGESRYTWQHYIPHRREDLVAGQLVARGVRTSLTFRKARGSPCTCPHPEHCDSQASPVPPTRALQRLQAQHAAADSSNTPDTNGFMESLPHVGDTLTQGTHHANVTGSLSTAVDDNEGKLLADLESKHVHQVYDAIAPHFSATRFAIWPEVRKFIMALPSGAVVADVGCGNGKYFGVRSDIVVLGSDRSSGLAAVAMRSAAHQAQRSGNAAADACIADGLALPYRPGSMDAVLCIAVLHHISSVDRRIKLLAAVRDVLRPGAHAIVTVWSTKQENPAKTLAKWQPIAMPADLLRSESCDQAAAAVPCSKASSTRASDNADTSLDSHTTEQQHYECPHDGRAEPKRSPMGSTVSNGASTRACLCARQSSSISSAPADYYVPWHIPFHRAGCHLTGSNGIGKSEVAHSSDAAAGKIDQEKRTVVFQRYCHLYAERELEELIEGLPGVALTSSVWDASNWVVEFKRSVG